MLVTVFLALLWLHFTPMWKNIYRVFLLSIIYISMLCILIFDVTWHVAIITYKVQSKLILVLLMWMSVLLACPFVVLSLSLSLSGVTTFPNARSRHKLSSRIQVKVQSYFEQLTWPSFLHETGVSLHGTRSLCLYHTK
jgi:hypothetical protein